jgi:hypothetical protein
MDKRDLLPLNNAVVEMASQARVRAKLRERAGPGWSDLTHRDRRGVTESIEKRKSTGKSACATLVHLEFTWNGLAVHGKWGAGGIVLR